MVLDLVTGELLAMVSLPDFDPNRVGKTDRIEYLNRNLAEVYELGSVFKILTIAAALDTGKVRLKDRFDATGKLVIGRHRIGDDHAKNKWLSVSEIFEYSSNIGTARMAFAAGGAPVLEDFFRRVGFYATPAIEIAEVVRPRTPKKWAEVTVATTSFGHGIAVTPLQFVDAVGGLVRDGTRVPPTLLKRDPGSDPAEHPLRLRADRRAAALADVARGRARHRHAGQPRQLRDRRQDRHGREAQGRPLQPGQRAGLFRRRVPDRRAALRRVRDAGRAQGRRQHLWPALRRLDRGSGGGGDHRPDRADPGRSAQRRPRWRRSIGRGWPSCIRRHAKLTRREASLAPGSAVR